MGIAFCLYVFVAANLFKIFMLFLVLEALLRCRETKKLSCAQLSNFQKIPAMFFTIFTVYDFLI